MEEALIKRILPHSIEAERSVISSMLMGRDVIQTASEIITSDDFYQHQYGILFETMVELANEGIAVDLVTLQNRLRQKDVPPEISSMDFVKDLLSGEATSVNIKDYAAIVRDKAMLRRMIRTSEEIENACYLDREDADVIVEDAEKKMFKLFERRSGKELVPIRTVVVETLKQIEAAAKTKGNITGIPTGFSDLDYMTSGLQNSDFILIAARPSMGKTALALNIAEYMAFRKNKAVAIFSLEMSSKQLMNRLFAMETKVDSSKLRNGNLKDDEWTKLVDTVGVIGKSRLMIDDTSGISVNEMRSRCRKMKIENGLDIIFVDYLQLMTDSAGGKGSDSRQQQISNISRGLKGLARELDVPVVALSQLSRAVEQRGGSHKPQLSDLRDSGAIEQDADIVMFIYRKDYYEGDYEEDEKNIAEIIIAKQRNGPIGSIKLLWQPDFTKFQNLAK